MNKQIKDTNCVVTYKKNIIIIKNLILPFHRLICEYIQVRTSAGFQIKHKLNYVPNKFHIYLAQNFQFYENPNAFQIPPLLKIIYSTVSHGVTRHFYETIISSI